VKLADPAEDGGFGAAFGNVHLADGEARSGAGVAFAAGGRQVFRVDGGLGIGGRKDVVDAVAAGAVGHGLRAGFAGEAVEGGIEADEAVGREAEAAGEADVAMAAAAGIADVGGIDGRSGIFGFDDAVFAVAIGAEGGLGDPAGDGLAVDAGA